MKAKAKAKKKRTVYVVAWAEYNHNQSKDALGLGVFGHVYPTKEAAHDAIMQCIRDDVGQYLDDRAEFEDEPEKEGEAEEIIRGGLWEDSATSVRFEMVNNIEYAYEVQEIEV